MKKMTEQDFCQKCNDIDEDVLAALKGNWVRIAIIFGMFGFMVGIVFGYLVWGL